MTSLLSLEWLKVKNYRTFWVMLSLFGVLLAVLYLFVSAGLLSLGKGALNLLSRADSFSTVWGDLCFYASYFVILMSVLITILVTNEYQFRTNRQNIIDGWTRLEFYHAKWQVVLALSVAVTVFTFVLGLLSGLLAGISLATVGEGSIKLIWLFLSCVNYMGLAFLLSVLFKRSGITIGIFMAYSIMIEAIFHWIFFFKGIPSGDLFLPLQACDELLPSVVSKASRAVAGGVSRLEDWAYAVATMCWISLYYVLGRLRILRSDW